jgi:hypothetical protein
MIDDRGNIGMFFALGIGAKFRDYALPTTFEGTKMPFFLMDLKIGPNFRIEASDAIHFDIYGTFGGISAIGGYIEDDNYSGDNYYPYHKPTAPALGFQAGFGIDITINRILLGTEFTFSKVNFKYEAEEVVGADGYSYPVVDKIFEDISLNSFRFYIGFALTK